MLFRELDISSLKRHWTVCPYYKQKYNQNRLFSEIVHLPSLSFRRNNSLVACRICFRVVYVYAFVFLVHVTKQNLVFVLLNGNRISTGNRDVDSLHSLGLQIHHYGNTSQVNVSYRLVTFLDKHIGAYFAITDISACRNIFRTDRETF